MSSAINEKPDGRDARIIYLSQLFDPEPTFKGLDFIRGLESHGLSVEVVTGFPNYPGGKIYDGYRVRALQREQLGHTEVTRVAMYPSHDSSALRRIATYFSFMVSSFFYLSFRAQKADLVYVYYPALTAGLAAIASKLFRGTPVVLDVQDMWPDSLGSSGLVKNQFLLRLANAATNLVYRNCDHIVVLSPGFKALLVERGVPEEKVTIIYNWAAENHNPPECGLPVGIDASDALRVLFAGNMGAAQQLDTVIDAATELQAEGTNCVFYFMGAGIERDRLAESATGLTNVRFLPRVPLSEVQRFLAAADVLLVHLADEPLFRITIPSKTQAYLYAGKPILMGVAGDARAVLEQANAGYAFRPCDARALAECVRAMRADGPKKRAEMGRNGHSFYMNNLCRRIGIQATADIIDRFRRRGAGTTTVSGDAT